MSEDSLYRPEPADELQQRYEFSRHMFQLFVSWFTVFIGVNTAVLGWVAAVVLEGSAPPLRPLVVLSILLAFQNVLGVIASFLIDKQISRQGDRVKRLAERNWVAFPGAMYHHAALLMLAACASYVVAWCIIPFVV